MRIVYARPWLLIAFLRLAGLKPSEDAIYTFGSTVYAPGPLTPDIIAHEGTHVERQQGFLGALRWWVRYAVDKQFRAAEEIEAYGAQYGVIQNRLPRRYWPGTLRRMAQVLGSPMYDVGLPEFTLMRGIEEALKRRRSDTPAQGTPDPEPAAI